MIEEQNAFQALIESIEKIALSIADSNLAMIAIIALPLCFMAFMTVILIAGLVYKN